ncbi:MAG: DUF6348 family protein [Clostridium sp.]
MGLYDNKLKSITYENKALAILVKYVKGSSVKNGQLFITDINLVIDVMVKEVRKNYAYIIFTLKHRLFDEPLMDSVASIGNGEDDSIGKTVGIFYSSTLSAVTNALRDMDGIHVNSSLYKEMKNFKCYKSYQITLGKKSTNDKIDFYNILGEEIIKRLGNKKVQWVKLYAAKTDSSINCECRINGVINIELSNIIESFAREWEIQDIIYSEKQYFIFIQDVKTYRPCKFTRENILYFTNESLKYYGECNTIEKYHNLPDEILKITKDKDIGTELYLFIPEILCELLYPEVLYLDEMIIQTDDSEIKMYKEQFSSYNYIYECISEKLRNREFTKENLSNILKYSAEMNSINEAIYKGSKIEELVMTAITYNVYNEYKPS